MVTNDNCDTQGLLFYKISWRDGNYNILTHISYILKNIERKTKREKESKRHTSHVLEQR